MTSEEITNQMTDYDPDTTAGATAMWLREIAYQLAVGNERLAKKDEQEEMDSFAQDIEKRLADNMLAPEADSKTDAVSQRGGWRDQCSVEACYRFPYFSFCGIWICAYHRERIDIRGRSIDSTSAKPPLFYVRQRYGSEMVDKWLRDLDEFCKSQPSPRSPISEPSAEVGSQKHRGPSGFPNIAPDGSGKWGLWYGPGAPAHTFLTEHEAQTFLQNALES